MSIPRGIAFEPAPPRTRLSALVDEVAPGGHLLNVRRLAGGISTGMHVLEIQMPSQERRSLVLRRYGDYWIEHDPRVSHREFLVLSELSKASMPAPRPVWVDPDGTLFDRPALVTTLLPGRGTMRPRSLDNWIRKLAAALHAVHAVPIDDTPLSSLEDKDARRHVRLAAPPSDRRLLEHPRAPRLYESMQRLWPSVERGPRVLLHGDFWGGNTLWKGGELTGIVDWEQAALGSRESDVIYSHMDFSLCMGSDVGDRFLARYEDLLGRPLDAAPFWFVLAAWRALPDPAEWAPGWRAFGLTDLTPTCVRQRFDAYIGMALERAGA